MSQSEIPDKVVEIACKLADKLPLTFIKQLDEWAGDAVKHRRFKNLLATMEKGKRDYVWIEHQE